ncbi:MAG: nucleotide exchange factor GrpE [Candidatus Geothermincolia bacterium]
MTEQDKRDTTGGGGATDPKEGAAASESHHAKPTKHDLEAEVAKLTGELEGIKDEAAGYLDDLLRLKADFENYRKRMLREQTAVIESANASLVEKLLPVLDHMDLALQHVSEQGSEGVAEGFRMVRGQLLELLRAQGLEEVDPAGAAFDPNESEAMMTIESHEHPDCTVLEVHKKGYRYRGKLLRPAMVSVSRCTA